MENLNRMAEQLYEGEMNKQAIRPLTEDVPDLTIDDAYRIQLLNIERKLEKGARIVGKKIGLTSRAMQTMLGVDQPDYGHLLDDMRLKIGEKADWGKLFQPKVEGELAFILKKRLIGPGLNYVDVLNAVEAVIPSIEVVDSRIKDWKIKLADTVADNASSGLFLLGETHHLVSERDLSRMGMSLYKNGELIHTGVGAAALGHPLYAVTWLANFLGRFDIALEAGEVILSGALTAAVDARPGDMFEVVFEGWETLRLAF